MSAIIAALVSFFGWGIGDVLGAVALRKLGVFSMSFWTILFSLGLFLFIIPFEASHLRNLTLNTFLINIGLSVLVIVGGLSFGRSLIMVNPAIASALLSSSNGLTVVLAFIFLKESLTFYQGLFVFLILFGVVLVTSGAAKLKGEIGKKSFKGIGFALIAMIAFAIEKTLIRFPIQEIGWFWPTFIIYSFFIAFLFLLLIFGKKLEKPTKNNAAIPLFASAIFARSADLAFNLGILNGLTAIVAPIAGASPSLVVGLSFIFFKDPIAKVQILGIILTLIGIIALSLLSV